MGSASAARVLRCGALVVIGITLVLVPAAASVDAGAAVPAASNGARTLTVSQDSGLDPNGQSVQVTGSGYDDWKGVYVAFCLVPPPGQMPTPCGGGIGGSGSAWFRSDQYGEDNGATPFGPGGSFSTSVFASPTIGSIDCRRVQCAVVTRSDHKDPGDRSQDVIVPVSFATPADPGPAPGGGPAPTTGSGGGSAGGGNGGAAAEPGPDFAAIAAAVEAERLAAVPAPALTLAGDGLSVTDGTRTLRVTRATRLGTQEQLRIGGHGYDAKKAIDVALCVIPTVGAAPSQCLTQPTTSAAWVAAGPAPDGRAPTETYGADGTFAVALDVTPVIADGVDCRDVACAIVTRNDANRPNDRSQDLIIPVSFVKAPSDDVAADTAKSTRASNVVAASSDGSASPWIIAGVVALLLVGGATFALVRRRHASPRITP